MIQTKICLIGAYAVGKTSLVQRFVKSIYAEKYHTTIGVKIDKKVLSTSAGDVTLMIWDLAGKDDFWNVEFRHVKGADGYLLVADGTRRSTLDTAIDLQRQVEEMIGSKPFRFLINKADIEPEWEITSGEIDEIRKRGWNLECTSAKSGHHVEEAFRSLAEVIANEP